jgi:N5-(carboxyethyl)ornithine synthase
VREEVLGCHYVRIRANKENKDQVEVVQHDGTVSPLIGLLHDADIIVNGIFQDPGNPVNFVQEDEVSQLKSGCVIIDVSCDEGMGFPFAKPTTFEDPMFKVGQLDYYAVDHTPSYLWASASWEISSALIRFLPVIMGGEEDWLKMRLSSAPSKSKMGSYEINKSIPFKTVDRTL